MRARELLEDQGRAWPIPENEGYEGAFFGFLRAFRGYMSKIGCPSDIPILYATRTFEIRAYTEDRECDCGADELYDRWWRENSHADDCCAEELKRELTAAGLSGSAEWPANATALLTQIIGRLSEKYGVPVSGVFGHCTCGRQEEMAAFRQDHPHVERCLLVAPNFWHYPSGLQVTWYKRPLLEACANRPVLLDEWTVIMNDCRNSLRGLS